MKKRICLALASIFLLVGCQEEETIVEENPYQEDMTQEEYSEEEFSESDPFGEVSDSLKAGETFPKFTTLDFNGEEVSEEIFAQNDLTLVNFWFTGCQPCVMEMPILDQVHNKWEDSKVQVLGICTDIGELDQVESKAGPIIEETEVSYKNLIMDDGPLFQYSSQVFAYPTTIFVDSEGQIVGQPIVGAIYSQEDIKELENQIEELLEAN